MTYNPYIHHRRSIRLQGFDYSQPGAYFVSICTRNTECLFGEIVDMRMLLNEFGELVKFAWHDLPNHISNIQLDTFVVMPNHVHGIIVITDDSVGAGSEPAPTGPVHMSSTKKPQSLPEMIRQFKTFSARRINQLRETPGVPVWQRNYYEHIVRDNNDLSQIREYIIYNPLNWHRDEYNI